LAIRPFLNGQGLFGFYSKARPLTFTQNTRQTKASGNGYYISQIKNESLKQKESHFRQHVQNFHSLNGINYNMLNLA